MEQYHNHLQLAKQALKEYDLPYQDLSFLIEETNIFFLFVSRSQKYVLKIFQEESSKLEDNLLEALLLREVSSRTSIIVPSIVPTKDGQEILLLNSTYFPQQKRVAVYNFVEGIDLNHHETDELFTELGRTTATLHQATRKIKIPMNLTPKRWDKVFYYRDEVAIYHQEKYKTYFKNEDITLLDQLIEFLNKELPKYYQYPSYLIHADLNPWNVKIHHNQIRLFDFEEGMEGNIYHEMAILLFYYRYDPNFDYDKVKALVFKGYNEIDTLPDMTEYDIDVLIIARITNFINYVLILHEDPSVYIQRNLPRIRQFLKKYSVL